MAGSIAELKALTPEQLISAYNGRRGCACGCRGRHSYVDAAEGTRDRGYTVTPDEVSVARVANTLRTIQEHAAEAEFGDGGIWSYESETRMYIAYVR